MLLLMVMIEDLQFIYYGSFFFHFSSPYLCYHLNNGELHQEKDLRQTQTE